MQLINSFARVYGNTNCYRHSAPSDSRSEHPNTPVQVNSVCGYQARLNEKEHEPTCEQQTVYVQIEG